MANVNRKTIIQISESEKETIKKAYKTIYDLSYELDLDGYEAFDLMGRISREEEKFSSSKEICEIEYI